MVPLTNLSRAYVVMAHLNEAAKDAGFKDYNAGIYPHESGELFFYVRGIGASVENCFLKGIETSTDDNFAERAEKFRDYWLGLIAKAKASNEVRITELKAELARLEGRA